MKELCGRSLTITDSGGKPLAFIGENADGDGCLRLLGVGGVSRIELRIMRTSRHGEVATLQLNDGRGQSKASFAIAQSGAEIDGEGL